MACKCCYLLLQLLRTQVCTTRLSSSHRPLRQLESLQAVPRPPIPWRGWGGQTRLHGCILGLQRSFVGCSLDRNALPPRKPC